MAKDACELFEMDLPHIQQLGRDFYTQIIHPEDLQVTIRLISEYHYRGRNDVFALTFFQRIKVRQTYKLAIVSLRIDYKKKLFVCIFNLTDQLPLFTTKVLQTLEENKSIKALAKKYFRLTKREREIVPHLAQGIQVKILADQLHISVRTLEQHKKNIYAKLEINSLNELIQIAYALQVVDKGNEPEDFTATQ